MAVGNLETQFSIFHFPVHFIVNPKILLQDVKANSLSPCPNLTLKENDV